MIEKVFIVSLVASFILMFLNKRGLLLWYEAYRLKWMPAGTCFFCIGFWISCFITTEMQLVHFMMENFAIPFLSSVIINFVMISSTK